MKRIEKALLVMSLTVLGSPAFAQIDATAATAEVTAVGATLTAVGTAIVGLAAIALGIRWVKATFF